MKTRQEAAAAREARRAYNEVARDVQPSAYPPRRRNTTDTIGWIVFFIVAAALLAALAPSLIATYAPAWLPAQPSPTVQALPTPFGSAPIVVPPVIYMPIAPVVQTQIVPTSEPIAPTAAPVAATEGSKPARPAPGAKPAIVQSQPIIIVPTAQPAPGGIDLDTSIHVGGDGVQIGGSVEIKNAPDAPLAQEHSRPSKPARGAK